MTDLENHLPNPNPQAVPPGAAPFGAVVPAIRLADIPEGYAQVNVTYAGHNGDLRDPVSATATDEEIRRIVEEALLADGAVRGIPRQDRPTVQDFVVERFAPNAELPYERRVVRPKTAYGAAYSPSLVRPAVSDFSGPAFFV